MFESADEEMSEEDMFEAFDANAFEAFEVLKIFEADANIAS